MDCKFNLIKETMHHNNNYENQKINISNKINKYHRKTLTK